LTSNKITLLKQLTDFVFPSTKIQHAMCPHTFHLY